jgi:predicted dehydrogenase
MTLDKTTIDIQQRKEGEMSELRVALLGSGYMGKTYAECISKYNTRGRLVAIGGGSRAPALAAEYGVDFAPTYEAILARADVDAVLIATPHTAHIGQVVQAAAAGKHVLVEKPMATSVADCTTMIEACQRAGVRLEVIKTLRFRGTLARAKQMILDGKIGQVRMLRGQALFTAYLTDKSWAHDPAEGGPSLDMGVHCYDILRFLTSSMPTHLFSHMVTFGDTPQRGLNVMTQITFASGAFAQQWISYEMPKPSLPDSMHRYYVVGDQGILDIDGYGKLLYGTGEHWELVWQQPAIDFIKRPMEPARLEAFYTQTQSFIDDVVDNRPDTVSGADGRAAVEMVEASWRSAQSGETVRW